MIIICPSCEKKFEVDDNLIPEKGRVLKCGSCDQTWFFNKNDQINTNIKDGIAPKENNYIKKSEELFNKIEEPSNINKSKISENKGSEVVKYNHKSNFTISKFLSYILVGVISLVGLIIILDTFKSPLYNFFPKLEFLLFSFYEILKDILLFVRDLA